jgi:NTP pyrophosphatase (non-canonical NTP hydrolase)
MLLSIELVDRCRRWVRDALGAGILYDTRERALRHLEEAMELAQALGVGQVEANALSGRVWSRPPGRIQSEAAGSLFTLVVLADVAGIDLEEELMMELKRVERPELIARIREKHAEKVKLGIGRPL